MPRSLCLLAGCLALLGAATAAPAQVLHGAVRDSASGLPVPGAIVTLLDSAGRAMTRNLSNESGLYRAKLLPQARTVRFLRLGFRPREVALPVGVDDVPMDVALQSLPFLLQAVHVQAGRNCPRRADRGAALALLEQARAGLLATVVSRSEQPARMTRLVFRRTLDAEAERATRQTVHLDSTAEGSTSFFAVQRAGEFVRRGFMRDSAGSQVFLAPDAETLLDDGFASGYCFHIMPRDPARAHQIGLGFAPGRGRRPAVEIEGALWIDTVARALSDIEFRYVGLGRRVESLRPGGRVAFRDMGNGTALVDSWQLRLIGGAPDTIAADGRRRLLGPNAPIVMIAQESGGELARAVWPTGRVWDASLGVLRARAVTAAGAPATGTVIGFDDTDYRGTVDSTGLVVIPQLVPGPYRTVVFDPRLEPLGIALYTALAFTASRGATVDATVVIPTAEDFVRARCQADRRIAPSDSVLLVGRVRNAQGAPVRDARITFTDVTAGVERPLPFTYETGSDGLFQLCVGLRTGMQLRVHASRSKGMPVESVVSLDAPLTVVPLAWQLR